VHTTTVPRDPTYERLAYEAAVYVLLPKGGKFIFALIGAGLYEGLFDVKGRPR
jgi:hypothetical protein